MGEMADWINEQAEDEEESEERFGLYDTIKEREGGKMFNQEEVKDGYHPFIWTSSNGKKVHIKDMGNHHLGNAIRHLETILEGREKPRVYFNMLQAAYDKGLGITDSQIKLLLAEVSKKKKTTVAVYNSLPGLESDADVLLKLEDDKESIALVVCNEEGEQQYPIVLIRRGDLSVRHLKLPADSLLHIDLSWPG